MRKRMAFRLQDEAKQLKGLFKDLVSHYRGHIQSNLAYSGGKDSF